MTSIKAKYRPSITAGKEGTIYYQIIHNRVIRQIRTDYHILNEEWNQNRSCVTIAANNRKTFLHTIKENMASDLNRLKIIIGKLENTGNSFTADDIVEKYQETTKRPSFLPFMKKVIARLKQLDKERTAENYTATLNSFMRFRGGNDVSLDEITSDLMSEYEAHLKGSGIAMNTISFYMRILRAVYNRAAEKGLTGQQNPFRYVYTGIDKTVKRAISMEEIKRIKELDLFARPSLEFARDIFLFSFYTRGMSFIDIAYLKKSDLKSGILSYRRRKTGSQLFIKWERCMQEIVNRYPANETEYLLPIITAKIDGKRQYRNALRLVNNKLKEIATMAGLQVNLTMYVSRHSWASIAKSKNIPVSVISEGMGHNSEVITQIYLASLDNTIIDKANNLILRSL